MIAPTTEATVAFMTSSNNQVARKPQGNVLKLRKLNLSTMAASHSATAINA